MSIYLDYNASSPIEPRVLDEMIQVYRKDIGNSDSRTHNFGQSARDVVELGRKKVSELLGVKSDEIFFTSGATESNNIAIRGLKDYGTKMNKKHIITTSIEHKAILETTKYMQTQGFEVDYIHPGKDGRINAQELLDKVRDDTLLVSVMHVNNETGIIQPIDVIGKNLSEKNVLFHVDATQSCGKLVEELKSVKYNMLSFSAHKLQGPQGIGVLVVRKNNYKRPPIKPIIFGGQQEHGISPGTVPVALVAGIGKACEIALKEYKRNATNVKEIKETAKRLLAESSLKFKFNGDQDFCLPSTINVCIDGVSSEALMLSSKQYCGISNGSACTSQSYSPSYVLAAMGISEDDINNSIRVSWGPEINKEEFEREFTNLLNVARELCI